jgi:exonuclease SbcD
VLVAGDLFDAAAPSPAAEQIVYQALLDLAEIAPVIIVSGNHDHPGRLRAVSPLLGLGRVTVGSHIARPHEGGVVTLPGLGAKIALAPFIGKRGIVGVEEIMTLSQSERIGEYAERVVHILEVLCHGMGTDTVNLLIGHLMVSGGEPGGGERTSHLFDYAVPALSFPGHLSYVALGHLHRSQRIPAPAPLWYSGSPLQLDFGEKDEPKSVLVVEAEPGIPARVATHHLKEGKRLRTLRGTLAEIEAIAPEVGEVYLRVVLEEKGRAGLNEEVRNLLPGAVEVQLAVPLDPMVGEQTARRLGRDPGELFREYLSTRNVDDPAMVDLFDQLVAASTEESGGP